MQQPAASKSREVADAKPEGDWEGTLDAGPVKLRIVLHITRKEGGYGATLDSPDQGAMGIPIETVTVTGDSIKIGMKSLGATYVGKLARDGSSIAGDFTQGQTIPLTFTRVASSGAKTSVLDLRKIDVGGHSLNLLIGGRRKATLRAGRSFAGRSIHTRFRGLVSERSRGNGAT